jgi:PhnB protein
MISGMTEREVFPAYLYIYIADADEAYDAAIRAGAISIEAPWDTAYADRRGMIRDPFGNVFQIAHPIEPAS